MIATHRLRSSTLPDTSQQGPFYIAVERALCYTNVMEHTVHEPKQSLSIMAWVFLATNMVYGIGFVLGGNWSGVNQSSLFQALDQSWEYLPEAWGGIAFVASVVSFVAYKYQNGWLGNVGSMAGFGAWLYATWTYALNGFWLVVFTVGVLYLMFWVSYYFTYISKIAKNGLNNDA